MKRKFAALKKDEKKRKFEATLAQSKQSRLEKHRFGDGRMFHRDTVINRRRDRRTINLQVRHARRAMDVDEVDPFEPNEAINPVARHSYSHSS